MKITMNKIYSTKVIIIVIPPVIEMIIDVNSSINILDWRISFSLNDKYFIIQEHILAPISYSNINTKKIWDIFFKNFLVFIYNLRFP
jgi:hypothetical protein